MTDSSALNVLIEYEIRKDSCSMDEWLDVWQDRAVDALGGEPETSTYEAAVSQDHPEQVLVFERYSSGQASLDAHSSRAAHAQLMQTMSERNMTRRRVMSNLFSDIDHYGWWTRDNGGSPMLAENVILTIIGTRFADEQARQAYIDVTREHAVYCREAEPDTLVYNGCLAQRDADRGPDIKTGDLIFIAAFRDQAAAVKHRDDPRHVALQPVLAEIPRERKFALTYLTSGKGFLWK
jgi:quinol monooxygenase YgiN